MIEISYTESADQRIKPYTSYKFILTTYTNIYTASKKVYTPQEITLTAL